MSRAARTGPSASATGKRRLPVVAAGARPLDAEALFREHFLPLYPPGADLAAIRATDANPGENPAILAAVEETAELFAALAPEALGAPGLRLDFSDASVHRLGALLTREARDRLAETRPSPGEPPLLVHLVVHGAVYVGACVVRTRGARWLVRSPLWETRVVLRSQAGVAELAPFSWWLRSLSDGEIERVTLGDRYRTHVEEPTLDASAWPVVAPPGRKLPRLARPTYAALVQYTAAHLPEVRDLGEDFPSPPRFDELGLRWLEVLPVGGGRALLFFGPGRAGVHAFWVSRAGFVKSIFFEADAAPEPRVRAVGGEVERIVFSFARGGAPLEHEVLWWGP